MGLVRVLGLRRGQSEALFQFALNLRQQRPAIRILDSERLLENVEAALKKPAAEVQQALCDLGVSAGAVDGEFGPRSKADLEHVLAT
ncbi:peptidoglycan-binding domain-containing protein [Azospirillum lipoferum]|uniref:peptidoglycan-binding domain-containing protein n=1 Tax=Azospirillum lipoferum TaxID=193 RepID=UPI00139617CA|nr:hypothetical protein [Azospirillum lipoferum]